MKKLLLAASACALMAGAVSAEDVKIGILIGFTGPMRPDHVPQLDGEEDGEPGYTMMGRLFAYGYMRGLIQAAQS